MSEQEKKYQFISLPPVEIDALGYNRKLLRGALSDAQIVRERMSSGERSSFVLDRDTPSELTLDVWLDDVTVNIQAKRQDEERDITYQYDVDSLSVVDDQGVATGVDLNDLSSGGILVDAGKKAFLVARRLLPADNGVDAG